MKATSLALHVEPIAKGRSGYKALVTVFAVGTAYWLYYFVRLMIDGHTILGTESYGATWGLAVANIIHIIGISHVGIAVSATVRVLGLKKYRSVARLAELVTLVALVAAVVNIAVDVGRPDRFLSHTLLYGRWNAPMVWSMTVILLYFLASGTYLYLSARRDFWVLSDARIGPWRVYRFLAAGYTDTQGDRARHTRALFWLAILLVPIMISVHSVYGLFFGLLQSKPGWFNPLQAPYFVLAAIVSGFSAIIVIAAWLRRAFHWRELIPNRVFKVFGVFLAFVVFLYLYFVVSEQLTAQFVASPAEEAVSNSLLIGRYSLLFWMTILVGLVLPFGYLFGQGLRKDQVNVVGIAVAAMLVNLGMWVKRYLIVVPSQYQPHLPLPRPLVAYSPTYAEWVLVLGTYALAALIFVALIRLIPLIELPASRNDVETDLPSYRRGVRQVAMAFTLTVAVMLIAWGVLTRAQDFASLKWLVGLTMLVILPLEYCLIPDAMPVAIEGHEAARD